MDQLVRILHAEPHRLGGGTSPPPEELPFLAHLSLDGDTLAYIPWPAHDVLAGRPHAMPPTRHRAVEKNRERLVRVVTAWAAAFPDRTHPNLAPGRGLELVGWLSMHPLDP